MGWVCENLGNGSWQITDDGTGNANPIMSYNGTISGNSQLAANFGRILNEQLNDNEQVLFDKPQTFDGTYEYIGVANVAAQQSSASWFVIRISYIQNRRTKMQFQGSMSWNNRTQGWPL